ncbi:MAG: pyridoxal phosphate-dependent aminotransferase [Clostridium sp.]|jgi:aspartate aminotransferase|uniref:pyridoxal phosphate-dependent aminotransferase n=1 Tax=Clostridium sp. TaxID=1506 RepID=UPI0025C4BD86|nr:pyridoxal phosphate-dependent aminotransferase [Clostridium sp.]MCH3964394.1 pyridoxal phosphate-dependent aminotransferase [Clostridium sp.]MCI1715569.1 pyridoxal phosphate-dependent aminotransferase [Clostridium sp.]MCI1799639.1 pyridoxal phosphate-dependent aminotransferase [Clostridium sp.]MCI1813753.1 pyridoxal phosphate-dependent aminotransferase [Clostridium sp.]MCI1870452.1 pyridoxal phosphate-dependent aminotransferase [Clostridium sp.]
MISEKMKQYVSRSSVVRAMFEEGKRLASIYGEENVFDFSLGNPNVKPPEDIKKSAVEILENESPNLVHGYMSNSGYEDVRSVVAENINKKYNLKISRDNLVMTCGAAGGLNIILKTIINPGDEVIAFSPFFGEYENYVDNFDGKLVIVPSNLETFEPDLNVLEDKINERTKAVIINSPNNPTGVVYSEKLISDMADVLNRKQEELNSSIYLISDEPYREIAYDGVEVPYMLKYYRNSFVGYSYSKSLSLPGERIGYVVCSSEMDDFEDTMSALNVANRILGFVNAPSLFQRVIGKCIDSKVDVNIYKKNRDLLYNHLVGIGFSCIKPEGAFYLFPKALIPDDVEFAAEAKKFNLLIVPGSSFKCPGYFRLAYCISYDKIEKSLDSFDKLAKKYL